MSQDARQLPIIGRSEYITLIELGIEEIPAKIDSGAYRCSIHADNIRVEDGVLKCTLFKGHGSGVEPYELESDEFKTTSVTNSFGQTQDRYMVKLKMNLMGKKYRTYFGLADRSGNAFPVLIGRRAMSNKFLIDTSIANALRSDVWPEFQEK